MSCGHCKDCGTGLERNGVCPNCDEAAFIMDWQEPNCPSEEFIKEASNGYKRASNRNLEQRLKRS